MAHIKVVRRSMRLEEWTDLRFGWLKRYIYEEKYEIKFNQNTEPCYTILQFTNYIVSKIK